MFEWLFLLFTPPGLAADAPLPPKEYYVGLVAAEAAYTTLQAGVPDAPKPPAPPPVDPKNCPTCKGTGRIRTGDDQNWTKCPTCQPVEQAPPGTAAGWPPKPRKDCEDGSCEIPAEPVTPEAVRINRSR